MSGETTMFSKRIVVTGMGAVTPIGNSVGEFWQALVEGRSGVGPVRAFQVAGWRPSYASEVKDLSPERFGLPRKKLKVMGRHAQLAFCAAHEAWADAGLNGDPSMPDRTRLGVILGIGMLNADVIDLGRAFFATAERRAETDPEAENFDPVAFGRYGAPEMLPLWLLRHIPNLAAAHISIALDARGPSNTITTGCVSGANALGEAARIIARGAADIVIAGGADARVSPLAMLRYRNLGWLATRDDVEPEAVSAPFDQDASGFVNGEGAGLLVLESLDHARDRGACVYAELIGYGGANDAHEFLDPHPDGRALSRAMSICLERGGVAGRDVDTVYSPATGVPAFDRAVASGLTVTFDSVRARPATTATRSVVGHTHAASAALDCVAAIKSIHDSRVPPTLNLDRPIADLPFVTHTALAGEISTAVVAAYGFGGHAAALAWQRSSV
jgi:3-oxoacyl-[acyl-carrier-protein] synthase II